MSEQADDKSSSILIDLVKTCFWINPFSKEVCFQYESDIPLRDTVRREVLGEVERILKIESSPKPTNIFEPPYIPDYNVDPLPLDRLLSQLIVVCRYKGNHAFVKPFLEKMLKLIDKGKGIDGPDPRFE